MCKRRQTLHAELPDNQNLLTKDQELQTMANRGTQDRMSKTKQDLSSDRRTGGQRLSTTARPRSGGESGTRPNCKPATKVSKSVSLNIEPTYSALMKIRKMYKSKRSD